MQNQGSVMILNSTANAAAPFPGSVVYLHPSPARQYSSYPHSQSVLLGAMQLVLGCLCIVFNIVSLGIGIYNVDISFVGHGLWCGALFIMTGAFGIAAGKDKTRCKISAYLILCIISASFTVALLVCGIMGSVLSGLYSSYICNQYGYSNGYNYYYQPPCSSFQAVAAMEGCMAVCGLIAAALFIHSSTLVCKAKVCSCCTCCACCCQDTYPSQTVIDFTHGIPNNFQVLNASSYPLTTMPYQQGMVAMSAPPPYPATFAQPNMVPGWQPAMGEVMVTGVAETAKY